MQWNGAIRSLKIAPESQIPLFHVSNMEPKTKWKERKMKKGLNAESSNSGIQTVSLYRTMTLRTKRLTALILSLQGSLKVKKKNTKAET